MFQQKPTMAYKRNRNLKEIIGSNMNLNNKVIQKNTFSLAHVAHKTLLSISLNIFKSYKTRKTYKIFHQLTCKNQAIIYLLQCRICCIQYVGKIETAFNVSLNNHWKDRKKKDAILVYTHFQNVKHISMKCKIHCYWTNSKDI